MAFSAEHQLPNQTPHAFFTEQLPAYLANARSSAVAGTFVFDVRGDAGGCWTLDLNRTPAQCQRGVTNDADCVISLSEEDFAAVLRRDDDLEELYYRQRVQVSGDLQKAAGLLPLFAAVTAPPTPRLDTLLTPYPAAAFLERHWPDKHLVVPPADARLNALRSVAPLRDVTELLGNWRGTVRVFPPGQPDQVSPHVAAETAAQLYAGGFTLVFDSVDLHFPDLHAWLETIQQDLALPPTVWGRCMVYATPVGSGFNAHFDENANFAVQLAGAKRWRISPNNAVAKPTAGHRLGGHVHPDLLSQLHAPLPGHIHDGSFEVTLQAGALLYLPRGHWHQTTATAESLSLNFTYDQPCWADVVTTALRSHLIRDVRWRGLATGAGTNDAARAAPAAGEVAARLKELGGELAGLDAAALLANLRPSIRNVELIDLKRDWVGALSHLQRPGVAPMQPASSQTQQQASVGPMLFERLLLGFENPGKIEGICQFEIDGPGGGEFHLVVRADEMRYADGRATEPIARVRMTAGVARELALGDNLDFRDQVNLDQIAADGDIEILTMLAQMTKLPNRDAGARFALAEERAAQRPRISEPKRVTKPSAGDINAMVEAGIPIIVQGGLDGWDEAFGWTLATLKEKFGHVQVQSTLGISTLGEFVAELDRADGELPPYTIGSSLPAELCRFFPVPFFDPESFGSAQLWLGSGPGRVSTLLHRDSGDAYLGQLIGRKEFKMYSPDQTPFMYVRKSYNRDQPCWVNPWEPDLERFPLFEKAVETGFTLHPGELLIIPRGWYHTVRALDTTMSIGFHREPVTDFGRILDPVEAS